MTIVSPPRRSLRSRKPRSYSSGDNIDVSSEVSIALTSSLSRTKRSTESTKLGRVLYRITKGEKSPKYPSVLVSFARVTNEKVYESSSDHMHVLSSNYDQEAHRESHISVVSGSGTDDSQQSNNKEPESTIISSDMEDSHHINGKINCKRATETFSNGDGAAIEPMVSDKKKCLVSKKKSGTRAAVQLQTKRLPVSAKTGKGPKQKIKLTLMMKMKEKPTKIIDLKTGTLYIYRGENPRADFVRRY